MADTPQSYANHTRWHPPFHFFVAPVMIINVIWAIVLYYQNPGWTQAWWILVSLALVSLAGLVRLNPLKAQDRIIRLEEQLRYAQILPADLARRSASLTTRQMIALRFASDEELAGLVTRTLAGEFAKSADIKKAIVNWRADNLRV